MTSHHEPKGIEDLIGLYWGASKIKRIEPSEETEMFKVYVKDSDNVLDIPAYELFACANKEKLDDTWMQRKRVIAAQEIVVKVLCDMNVRMQDIGLICKNLITDLENNWNKAGDKLFGCERKDLRLKKIDEVLKS